MVFSKTTAMPMDKWRWPNSLRPGPVVRWRTSRQFDLNLDGIVTSAECLQATDDGAVRGTVASTSSYAGSRSRRGETPSSSGTSKTSTGTSPTQTVRTSSGSGASIDQRYIDFSRKTLGKYDTNGNGSLEKDEWSKMPNNPAAADLDADGKISIEELAGFFMPK